MYHIWLIHSLVDEHLGGFHVLPIVNTAMTTGVQLSLQDTVIMKTVQKSLKMQMEADIVLQVGLINPELDRHVLALCKGAVDNMHTEVSL